MAATYSFFHYKISKSPYWYIKVILLILFVPLMLLAISMAGKKEQLVREPLPTPAPLLPIPSPAPYPQNKTDIYPGDEITARGVVVMDVDSHVYLYKRNEVMLLSPASTTKLLTALVALDVYKLDDVVTIASVSGSGQSMGLVPGEEITVENLLYGALIQSGNDAAWALAEHYTEGADKFIDRMNEKARTLHMDQSHFTNSTGFDGGEHKVTPMDLSLLALAAIQNKTIAKMVAIPQITVSDVNHVYFHKLSNVNQLLGKIPGVGGIKTGWTETAGENLITYVERNNRKIIFVVLHSKDRFGDTTKLIDWVFENYRWEELNK
jgi:D-alanyl-D-alanine carboxypeptidase (penicillin-binding protein 5/6)